MSNICFTFDFFFAQFVDYLNSVMAIDIMIERLQSEMSSTNMWHFVYVLKSILFDRGEKTDEILQGERQGGSQAGSWHCDGPQRRRRVRNRGRR